MSEAVGQVCCQKMFQRSTFFAKLLFSWIFLSGAYTTRCIRVFSACATPKERKGNGKTGGEQLTSAALTDLYRLFQLFAIVRCHLHIVQAYRPCSVDVGWNPMWTIFHVWSGSYEKSRRTRGSTKGNTEETREKSLNQQVINHTSARSPNTKRYI